LAVLFASSGAGFCCGFVVVAVILATLLSARDVKRHERARREGTRLPDSTHGTKAVRTGSARSAWHTVRIPPRGRSDAEMNSFAYWLGAMYLLLPLLVVIGLALLALVK
jgi:thiosulfate reductase cytochrome b subunit